jgi:nicotinic acid phosphoribosyltransferase
MTGALATDLYELNMAASYLRRGMTEPATFSLFVRNLPPSRGFLVATGLEDYLTFLERFRFDEDELDTLGGVRAAIDVIRQLGLRGQLGVRLDSVTPAARSRPTGPRCRSVGR